MVRQSVQGVSNFQTSDNGQPYYHQSQYGKSYPHFHRSRVSTDLDIEGSVTVRKAVTRDDLMKVFGVRWEGYKKYYKTPDENMDQFDFSPHASLLLAEDKGHNAVGTIRILDRRQGSVELDKFIDLDAILPSEKKTSVIEATRFSIPSHPESKMIKMLLWKALVLYCQINHIDTIVMSARPAAARSYRCLLFENVGPLGVYKHGLLGDLEHQTYICTISERKSILKQRHWPLYHFFFVKAHSGINTDYFMPYDPETEYQDQCMKNWSYV
ncbi:MAG: GNAT family N-acyltransferase [bacterium]